MSPANIFLTANSIPFAQTESVSLQTGDPAIWVVPCKQQEEVEDYNLGNTNGSVGQIFPLPSDYAHGSGLVLINGEYWEERPTFGRSNAEDKHYIVDVSPDKIPYIKFGDGINGLIPPAGQEVMLSYSSTQGAEGNVDPNTIIVNTAFDWTLIPWVDEVIISNPIKASGGADVEPIERIRENAPRSLRTLDRAVSKQDYIDVTMLAPGVRFADVFWDCGKTIDIYIAPNDGGIASLSLLADTKAFVDLRKMYTTTIRVSPSGETQLVIQLDVTANPYVEANTCKNQVEQAMVEEYEFENSKVNREIRLSDIYALIDNLVTVDFLNISILTTKPYARPLYSLTQLDADINTLPSSSVKTRWRIAYDGSAFRLFKNGAFLNQIYIGVLFTDTANTMSVLLNNGVYNPGDEWVFYTYPYSTDLEIDDYSVPILDLSNLEVNVTEQP
jgi:predicted phage baseplate assembly protein